MPPKPKKKRSPQSKRQRIPPGLRYNVLAKAKFRCEACGVPASEARLEIDHKKPVAKGGLNAIANLQVLCRSCNRGKAAKLKKKKLTKKT
jgi:5-methylcytosine-specific restriction endonuclease McrA